MKRVRVTCQVIALLLAASAVGAQAVATASDGERDAAIARGTYPPPYDPADTEPGVSEPYAGDAPADGSLLGACVEDCQQLVWETKRSVPRGIEGASSGLYGGRIYVIEGTELLIYNIGSNSWSNGPAAPKPHVEGAGVAVGNAFYAIGGRDAPTANDRYNGSWSTRAAMPTGRAGQAVVELNGKIHVIGGRTGGAPHSGTALSTHEVYDPGSDSWDTKASLPTPVGDCYAAVALDGRIYVFGGWTGVGVTNRTQEYNPGSNSWRTRAPMPTARSNAIAGVLGGRAIVIGGINSDPALQNNLKTVEVYDPDTDSWCTGPAKPTAASEMSATGPNTQDRIYTIGSGVFGLNRTVHEALFLDDDDDDPPTIDCPADLQLECPASQAEIDAWRDTATATDDCSDPTITSRLIDHQPGCGRTFTDTYEFTATDGGGQKATCRAKVIVTDTRDPRFTDFPADQSVECDAIPPWEKPLAADDCDTDPDVSGVPARSPGSCEDNFTITRTWTATDDCGNSVTQVHTIQVDDTTAPVLSGVPPDISVACEDLPDPAEVTVTDNCDPDAVVVFTEEQSGDDCSMGFTITRTWTSEDRCGNQVSDEQVITVDGDTEPPELVGVPADIAVECDDLPPPAAVTATDNCDRDPTVTLEESRIDGACDDTYTLIRRWTAEDDCGNTVTGEQVITVTDTTLPELQGVPADATVECDAVPDPAAVTATDNCDPDPSLQFTETRTDGSCEDGYELIREWVAEDRCGNLTTETQTITVRDTTAPELQGVPVDATVECDEVPDPAAVTATDNCDPDPSLVFTETRTDGSCEDGYELIREWVTEDRCGNVTTETQTITVRDTTAPELVGLPVDVTVECDAVPDPAAVTATDNCDPAPPVVFTETRLDGGCADSYQLVREWSAEDRCGNVVTETQTITVRDSTAPELQGVPADDTVECDAVPAPAVPTATDNCDPDPAIVLVETRTDGSCEDGYQLTREWTVTDRCGNATVERQILTVVDTTAPTITGVPADDTVECDAVPAPASPTTDDNCDPDPSLAFTETRTDGSCEDGYQLVREWISEDRCGNITLARQVLTVVDTTPPAIAGVPGDDTVECDAVPPPPALTATDNCDPDPSLVFTETRTDGSCEDGYTLTRTWTALDRCGNESVSTQLLTVVDTTAPTITGVPADDTVECDAVPPPASPTADDNCDPDPTLVFTETRIDGTCEDSYQLVREWASEDRCGNVTVATQVLTVVDTSPPVLAGVPADVSVECDAIPPPGSPTATDNCDPDPAITVTETRIDGRCEDNYQIVREYAARDRCGNATVETQIITVDDTTPPDLLAVLEPLPVGPPSSATSAEGPRSVCSAPSARQFLVSCETADNCDPDPELHAVFRVLHHDVPEEGVCVERWDEVEVACGDIVELELSAPPCPDKPPKEPRPSTSVTSEGVTVIFGEEILLDVTATDRCGNETRASFDPTESPEPPCEDPLDDGSCCPPIAAPADPKCKQALCGRCRASVQPEPVVEVSSVVYEACERSDAESMSLAEIATLCAGRDDPGCGGECVEGGGCAPSAGASKAKPKGKIDCKKIALPGCVDDKGFRCEATGSFDCKCSCL